MANTNELEQIEFPIVANSAKADETLKALFNKLLGIENKLLDISKNYKQSLIEINKLKNEKIYIPLDVTPGEQHKFLSDYVYKPY